VTEIRWVWLDGELLPADGRHISVYDRGFQLGDGVFETLRARAGHVAELGEHLARLHHSADGLSIHLPPDADAIIRAGIAGLLRADGLDGADGDASVRITVSRGALHGRGLLPAGETARPTIALQAWPVAPAPADHLERGLHLIGSRVRRDPENPLAALKTTSRADYVHARLEARHAGADDALFLTLDGHLSEATSANLFIVRAPRSGTGGRGEGPTELATPALGCAILPGTTRSWLLGWAARVGLRPTEAWLTTRELLDADEAFLCSSVAGVLPVTRYEGEAIGDGTPGPWTARARAAREAFIRGEPEPGPAS
jgi:branched-subunit amino acid aminotransferase/4-amino-4-deoxychorismate lyase